MSKIKILPKHIQNMIAAGEVIERPANVVKELMENSLDALADNIYCEIEGGGEILVLVQDNGMGMTKEDLILSVKRHATSKLNSKEDLFNISSFGFRGEALPSIGAVSHLKISTKTENEEYGHVIEVIYGEEKEISICAMNRGTKVEVRDLFLKVPARLKFLKSKNVETKRCEEVFYKIALCHLDREFTFVRDGKKILHFEKQEEFLERLSKIWPKKLVANFREVNFTEGEYKIYGYVGDPKYPQARGDRIIFYVNKRPVKDKILLKALKQAYSGKILGREYPCGVIFIDMPYGDLDVNVHPAKLEVRFRDESYVLSRVYKAVRQTLDSMYIQVNQEDTQLDSNKNIFRESSTLKKEDVPISYNDNYKNHNVRQIRENKSQSEYLFSEHKVFKEHVGDGRDIEYLGQVADSYLLVRHNDKIIVIDQHAAHERILYETLKRTIKKSHQKLLYPIEIEFPIDLTKEEILKFFQESGFLGEIKDNKVIILSYPSFLDSNKINDILHEFFTNGKIKLDDFIELVACKRAIKANSYLTDHEAMVLIAEWFKCENKDFCPHGRPTNIVLDRDFLDTFFKRK